MNASVSFVSEDKSQTSGTAARPIITVPLSAVKDGAVFLLLNGRAVRRAVRTGSSTPKGLRIEEGLIGGEDLIANPPAGLNDGDRVRVRQG